MTFIEVLNALHFCRDQLEPKLGIGYDEIKVAAAIIEADERGGFEGLDCPRCGGRLDAYGFCFQCLYWAEEP
jgi:hypothetical protein